MNCAVARDRLAERALGVLPSKDVAAVDRHVAWCAACRKEAGELDRAGASLAYAPAPATPDPALEDRVVLVVRSAAGRRHGARGPRRSKIVAALSAAALVAATGLLWGAAMADRAANERQRAQAAVERSRDAIQEFFDFVNSSEFADADAESFSARLEPAARVEGSGAAVAMLSTDLPDTAIVMVALPDRDPDKPLKVSLLGPRSGRVNLGSIGELDANGQGVVVRSVDVDLTGYTLVEVRTLKGKVLLSGSLTRRVPASPSP